MTSKSKHSNRRLACLLPLVITELIQSLISNGYTTAMQFFLDFVKSMAWQLVGLVERARFSEGTFRQHFSAVLFSQFRFRNSRWFL
jgi:hypothetical protein